MPVGASRSPWAVVLALSLCVLAAFPAAAKRSGVVVGRVVDQAGERLAGVEVTVTSASDPDLELHATSGADGGFTVKIPGASGGYLFRFAKGGFAPLETTVAVTAGDEQEMEFRLIDEGAAARRDAVLAYNAAAEAYQRGELASAVSGFQQATALDPSLPEPYLGLAEIHLRQGEAAAAAEEIGRFLAAKPDHPEGLRVAYRAYRDAGQGEAAAAVAAKLRGTPQAKSMAADVYNQGVAELRQGDTAAAVRQLEAALALDPELAPAQAGLATLYYNLELYDQALAAVDRLLELEPQDPQGRRIRFLVHDARQETEAAASAFEAYQEVDPQGAAQVLYQRADLDFRSGRTEEARSAVEKVLELDPDHARAHYTLGLICASQGAYDEAKKELRKFLELAPDDPEADTARTMLSGL